MHMNNTCIEVTYNTIMMSHAISDVDYMSRKQVKHIDLYSIWSVIKVSKNSPMIPLLFIPSLHDFPITSFFNLWTLLVILSVSPF